MTDNRGIRASQQGELDCLCGAYCVVNMLSWLYDGKVKRRPLMNRLIQAYQQRWPLHEWLTEGIEEDRLDWLMAQVLQKGHYSRQFPVEITRPFAGSEGYQTGDFSEKCSGFLTSLTTPA